MKTIHIPYIDQLNITDVEAAGDKLEELGSSDRIESLNWAKDYPYRPITYFYIGRSKQAIYIKYSVKGTMLKAVYTQDQEPVFKDSCVEFFCMKENAEKYLNFEFNCIGTCSSSRRKSRNEEVVRLTDEELKSIERYSTLGKRAFKEMEGMFEWELTVKIPFTLMDLDGENLPEKILANFNKCADDTDSVHYVSWSPIFTAMPDFHRPDFFGELYFL